MVFFERLKIDVRRETKLANTGLFDNDVGLTWIKKRKEEVGSAMRNIG